MKVTAKKREDGSVAFDVTGDNDPNGLWEPNYSTSYSLGVGDTKPTLHVRWHSEGAMHHIVLDSGSAAWHQLRKMAKEMRALAAAYEHWATLQGLQEDEVQPLFDDDGQPRTRW